MIIIFESFLRKKLRREKLLNQYKVVFPRTDLSIKMFESVEHIQEVFRESHSNIDATHMHILQFLIKGRAEMYEVRALYDCAPYIARNIMEVHDTYFTDRNYIPRVCIVQGIKKALQNL